MKPRSFLLLCATGCLVAGCDSNGRLITTIVPEATVTVEPANRTVHVGDTVIFQAKVTGVTTR
jgi:hypothetical protein